MISALARWRDRRIERRAATAVSIAENQAEAYKRELHVMAIRLAAAKSRANGASASGVAISQGRFSVESNQAWRSPARHTTVETMLTDAHVASALRSVEMPLRSAEWCIEPVSEDPRDVDIAEFVSANLLRRGGDKYGREYWCGTSWEAQRLPEILRMLADGCAIFHTSWRPVAGRSVYDRIQWLEPKSVDPAGWKLSPTDEIEAIWRTYQEPTGAYRFTEPMAADEIALYPWALVGARYEGRAMIRALYGAWSRKDSFLRAALSWASKVADGVPVGWAPPGMSDADKALFSALVHQLRAEPPPELAGVFTMDSDGNKGSIDYVGANLGDVDRMRGLIDGENAEMAHGASMKTQLLGETSSGSRALGDSIGTLEKMAVRAVANTICEFEQHGAGNIPGLIERLVDENFVGVKQYPKLTCRNLDPSEKTEHVPELIDAVAKKVIPALPKVQHRILAALGVEVQLEELEQAAEQQQARADQLARDMARSQTPADPQADPADPQDDFEADPAQEDPEDAQAAGLAANLDVRQKLGALLEPVPQGVLPKNALRWPNRLETETVDLAGVRAAYREGEGVILATLRRVQRAMVDELIARVQNGTLTSRNINGIRRSKFRGREKMIAALSETLQGVAARGTQHVADELDRLQKRTALAVEPVRVGGYRITPQAREELLGQVDTIAEIDLDRIWSRLLDQALPEFARIERSGKTGDDLAQAFSDYLTSISEKPLEDLTREEAGRAYNEGRDAAIQTAATGNLVAYVMRSEVLDDNTCDTCRAYDGRIVEVDSDEYTAYMPPAGCEGGPRCRGFYVLIPPEMTR